MTAFAFLWPFPPEARTAAAVRLLGFMRAARDLGVPALAIVPTERAGEPHHSEGTIVRLPLYDSLSESIGVVGALLLLAASSLRLLRALRISRSTCVISSTPTPFIAFQGLLASRILGVAFVLDIRDSWEIESATHSGRFRNVLKERLERTCANSADRVYCVTPTLASRVSTRYRLERSKVAVVANGADLTTFGPGDHRDIDLIFVGTPAGYRNVAGVLQAIAEIIHNRPQTTVRFLGWGDTPQADGIKQLARKLELPSSVEFLPAIPHDAVPGLVRRARLGIVSLSDDDRLRVAIGAKTYEYIACGVPLACLGPTGESELRTLVTQRSVGYYSSSPNDFAARGTALLDDEKRWSELSRNCVLASRDFDRRAISERALRETITALSRPGRVP